MTYLEQQCDDLWYEIVRIRDLYCQICRVRPTEAHHIFFKSQGNWLILFDTDYGVGLCNECHQHAQFAPHTDNDLFIEKILPRLPEDRQYKILTYMNEPKEPQIIKPDYKVIRGSLKQELKEAEETAWMNNDCEPHWGMTG